VQTLAILPVKRFGEAKRRLAGVVDESMRIALAEAMVRDVLLALARTGSVERTLMVTGEPRAAALGTFFGAELVEDPDDAGHNEAAGLGVARALELGAERAVLVPGDCPALDPGELDALLARHPSSGVVVVPDRHGTGTNALLLAPPDAIAPAFGPGSCERHAALGRAAGATVAVERVESLAYDVDTGEDLEALREQLARGDDRLATVAALEGAPAGDR
jgi:2-phospho-L-lactate/phosphoenolpyruvate guanylyltransferase